MEAIRIFTLSLRFCYFMMICFDVHLLSHMQGIWWAFLNLEIYGLQFWKIIVCYVFICFPSFSPFLFLEALVV